MKFVRGAASAVLVTLAIGVIAAVLLLGRFGGAMSAGIGAAAGTTDSEPTQGPAADAELPPLAPEASIEPPPGKCSNYVRLVDGPIETIDFLTAVSSDIVVGIVTGVGPARWNTADGEVPRDEHDIGSSVVRLVRVDVDEVVAGDADKTITLAISGGSIGCHNFATAGQAEPVVGQRLVLFLPDVSPMIHIEGALGPIRSLVEQDGKVATPANGTMTMVEIRAAIRAAKP